VFLVFTLRPVSPLIPLRTTNGGSQITEILIIDDELQIRRLLRVDAEAENYEVREVDTGDSVCRKSRIKHRCEIVAATHRTA